MNLGRNTDWTMGRATLGAPSPRPSPQGRGRIVHRLLITPVPEFAQKPSAKHQSNACCSLCLRERARVRGKNSVEHAKCSISQALLSTRTKAISPVLARFHLAEARFHLLESQFHLNS